MDNFSSQHQSETKKGFPLSFKLPKYTVKVVSGALAVIAVVKLLDTNYTERRSMPSDYLTQGEWFTPGIDFILKDSKGPFARIDHQVLHLTPHFNYLDHQGNVQAKAKQQLVSWGVKIDIYDANNLPIGSVEERIFRSPFKITSIYSIKDASGVVLGKSSKLDFLGSSISISDQSGQVVAEMSRPAWDLGHDTWTCKINPSIGFDPKLIVFIPAYKSVADSDRKSSSSIGDKK